MEQIGLVVEVKDDMAIVAVQRHDVCAKCGACGVAVSGRGETQLKALNKVNATVGQTVKVTSDTAYVLKASFVVYLLPILALLLGIYVGQQVEGNFAALRMDIILGFAFLLASYLLVRSYDRKAAQQKVLATVVEIIPESYSGPEDEKC